MQTKIKLIAIQSELQRKCKRKINNTFLQEIPIQLQTKENNECLRLYSKKQIAFLITRIMLDTESLLQQSYHGVALRSCK